MLTHVPILHVRQPKTRLAGVSTPIALAQINPVLGDLSANREQILAACRDGAATGAALICLPASALTGAPLHELARRKNFIRAAHDAWQRLADELAADGLDSMPVVGGCLDGDGAASTVIVRNGHVYRGARDTRVGSLQITVSIASCPAEKIDDSDIHIVVDDSPFAGQTAGQRYRSWADRARRDGRAIAWLNLVGGQDEAVFDGGSLMVDASGRLLARALRFTTDLCIAELSDVTPELPSDDDATTAETLYRATTLALHDYVTKSGIGSVQIGLSGGIDSALVAAIAVDALGPERVYGVSNPSAWSTPHSRSDAEELAARTGLQMTTIAIENIVDAFQSELTATGNALDGVAEENLQARIRAVIWMGLANQHHRMVLACGNKSELAVGYSTIYGDAVGGYAPIKDVPKTLVWQMARWRNAWAEQHGRRAPIPENTITKSPSAELRPGQKDTDTLPDYAILDPILDAYLVRQSGIEEIRDLGFDADVVRRVVGMVNAAEHKRRQYPPGPALSPRPLTSDHRIPLPIAWRDNPGDDAG